MGMKRITAADILNQGIALAGISNDAFSLIVEKNPSTISLYRSGKRAVPLDVLEKLESLLRLADVDIISLLPVKQEGYLYHSTTNLIQGDIDPFFNVGALNDFGYGFYLGENLRQAATWGKTGKQTLIYCFPSSALDGCNIYSFSSRPAWYWLTFIGYNRQKFSPSDYPRLSSNLARLSNDYDVVCGKIADSFNYAIIENMFAGRIDVDQAEMASVIIALGNQYCVKSREAASKLVPEEILEFDETLSEYFLRYRSKRESELESITKNILSRPGTPERMFKAILEKRHGAF